MKFEGSYIRKRDALNFTYSVAVRAAAGGAAGWDALVYLDGELVGEPGGLLLAPLPSSLLEDAIHAAVGGAIEAGLSMNR